MSSVLISRRVSSLGVRLRAEMMAQKHMQTGNRNAPVSTNKLRNESAWGRGVMINNSTEKEQPWGSPRRVVSGSCAVSSPVWVGGVPLVPHAGCPAGVQRNPYPLQATPPPDRPLFSKPPAKAWYLTLGTWTSLSQQRDFRFCIYWFRVHEPHSWTHT